MTDQYIGEIRLFAGSYAPNGWALCDGQLIPINQNAALFSLLGTYYGGDGTRTFGLPDLRGRLPMNMGQGPGLAVRELGEQGGEESVTLTTAQMPGHTHLVRAATGSGQASPIGHTWGTPQYGRQGAHAYTTNAPNTSMSVSGIGPTGGNAAHNNLPPYLVGTFIIALQGVFPQRP